MSLFSPLLLRRVTPLIALVSASACTQPQTVENDEQLASQSAEVIDSTKLIELRSFWNPAVGDNAMSTNPSFAASGYTFYRVEGRVFRPDLPQPTGTLALHTWYNPTRGDYFTTTNSAWVGSSGATREGYVWVRREGYVFSTAVSGTAPLQLWWSPGRADNFTTADPAWTSSTGTRAPDYGFARSEGFLVPTTDGASYAPAEAFHYGTLGNGPRGERDLIVFGMNFTDQPLRHTRDMIDSLVFGPGAPNVRDYFREMSHTAFAWRRAATLVLTPSDDPDTTADERSWGASWDMANPQILYSFLQVQSGKTVGAINGGGGATFTGTNVDSWEVFGLVDVNGGQLVSGDTIAFKTAEGKFLNESGGNLSATATSSFTTSARFVATKTGGGVIAPGDAITLRSVSSSRYVQETASGVDVNATATGPTTTIRLNKTGPDVQRQTRMMVAAAANGGFSFAPFDRNGDGTITRDELGILIIGSGRPVVSGGATRNAGVPTIPGSSLSIGGGGVASMGEDVSISTIAHELVHTIGSPYDMYGDDGLNQNATLMGATIFGGADDRQVFHLDPWHKMRFGWVRPQVVAINAAGGVRYVMPPQTGGAGYGPQKQPILIYSPSRYNVQARSGEFFMIERRDRSIGYYDANGPAMGVYVWQCKTTSSGAMEIIPAADGTGIDHSVNLYSAPDGTRGGTTPWSASHGTITLRYIDGTDAGIRLRVGSGANVGSVEWTPDGTLRPRVDGGATWTLPGSSFHVDGEFPASTSLVRLLNNTTGALTSATVTSWTSSRAIATAPSSLTPGNYTLFVQNGVQQSNSMPFEIR